LHRASEGCDNVAPDFIIGKDIGEDEYLARSGIHIFDQPLYRSVVIADQLDPIAADRGKEAEPLREVRDW
jgi:hypothetical protein